NAEGQHIAIVDSIHDGIGVQLLSKRLGSSFQIGVTAAGGILGKDGRTGKAKNMVVSEIPVHLDVPAALFDDAPYDAGVHIAKLAAVALIEYQNNVLIPDGMVRVF